jgi:predicted HAD superfamily Cof-like phosphohydrolase
MSNYQKILEFNKAFGVETNNTPQLDIFDKNPTLINYRLSLILEEVGELQDAIKQKDFVETIDALADIMYVTLGAFTAIGIDADKAFDLVHKSNMSKLCISEKEAQDTVQWYKDNQSDRYDSPNYRKSDDNIHWVVYNESTKKILKNMNYSPVKFDSLLPN